MEEEEAELMFSVRSGLGAPVGGWMENPCPSNEKENAY